MYTKKDGRVYYKISIKDKRKRDMLLAQFFELGIYPSFDERIGKLCIEGFQDLQRMTALNLDSDPDNQEKVEGILKNVEHAERCTPQKYYAVRKKVATRLDEKRKNNNWTDIVSAFCLPYVQTLRKWCADIFAEKTGRKLQTHKRPLQVRHYESILAILGLENIYAAQAPLKRHEKWFFPLEDTVYELLFEAQEAYLREQDIPEIDAAHAAYIHQELAKRIVSDKADLDFVIEGTKIEKISPKSLEVCANEKTYILLPQAMKAYRKIVEIDASEKLTETDADELAEEIAWNLNQHSRRRLDISFQGNHITEIKYIPRRKEGEVYVIVKGVSYCISKRAQDTYLTAYDLPMFDKISLEHIADEVWRNLVENQDRSFDMSIDPVNRVVQRLVLKRKK